MFLINKNKIIPNACFDKDEQNMVATSNFWAEIVFIATFQQDLLFSKYKFSHSSVQLSHTPGQIYQILVEE